MIFRVPPVIIQMSPVIIHMSFFACTMCKMLLKLRTHFSQNYVFKVGIHDFSKKAEPIGLKFLH